MLSEQQQRAVERAGQDVCVVAGPGSGKTRVLVERFAWLAEERGVDPGRILAITFTEKAATEMKERLTLRLPERRAEVERAWVSTIDAFCMRVLREHCIAANLPPDFSVLDAAVAARMERDAAEAALDSMFGERPQEMRRLLEALDLSTDDGQRKPDLAASLIDVYETMRLAGVRELPAGRGGVDVLPQARELAQAIRNDASWSDWHGWAEEFLALPSAPITRNHLAVLSTFKVNLSKGSRKAAGYRAATALKKDVGPELDAQWVEEWYSGLPALLRIAIERIGVEYGQAKRREAATDFADLEEKLIGLLETDDAVRARVQKLFDHVLMDELQDTNRLQWRLVNLIRGKSVLFAVGDINQSIYAFRHADRTVFTEYREDVRGMSGVIDELEENHRSRGEILAAVSAACDGQPGIESRMLTARREFAAASGPVVERLVASGDKREDVEASLVARRIGELAKETGHGLGDFAILVRTLASVEPFARALDRCGIPFVLSGGRTFLEARETRDLMALLAALVNPLDDIALVGVLRSPLAGWSDEEILRAGREGWQQEFEKLFGRVRMLAGFVAPDRLLAMALDECGYSAGMPERANANIGKLLGWLRREHRRRPRPLAELLEEMEALRKSQGEAEAPPPEASDAVRILTIHSAKGLEFPVVFVAALQKGTDSHGPVILFSAEHGLGVKWRHPVTGKGVSDTTHRLLNERRKNEEAEEQNRLLYVAMTRAEDRLVLSYSQGKRSAWVKRAEATVAAVTESDRVVEASVEAGRRPGGPPHREVVGEKELVGQYDSSASVTSVALFEACPRKYYLGRYLGLEAEPLGAGTGALELGTEVHLALAGQPTESKEAIELAGRFLGSELGIRAARASLREREFDFLLPVEDVILRGQIDLWFEDGGELILVDYKTDRDETRAGEYALQLRLYALALERYAGRVPKRATLCYLRSGHEVEVSVAGADLEAAKWTVRALRKAQDFLEFPMRVEEQCRRCSFYGGLCPARLEKT